VGYLDEQGRIWFCGRKAHRVTLADRTLFTIPCEGIFNAHPAVHRTALVDGGGIAVLCVELNESVSLDSQQLFAELREMGKRHEITRDIRHFVIHPSFPVDIRHNAKIFREKLAIWAKALHKRGQIREQP
jgi:acyl-coenzyme A synthetase/AMP-(fatty) acid ligase